MNILFCSDPLNNNSVDFDWEEEYQMAMQYNANIMLLDYDTYKCTQNTNSIKIINKSTDIEAIVYRGWMMPVELYKSLYTDLLRLNLRLINSPEEYEHCYHLPSSYDLIKHITPLSIFHSECNIPQDNKLSELLSIFGNSPIIVKDYVKSQKHYWSEACFIPDASDLANVRKITNKFIEMQADNFQGGLVFREFVTLEPVGVHPQSRMPLTKEYRLFILNKKLVTCSEYWEDAVYSNIEKINYGIFEDIFTSIQSNFFTIDIAKKNDGAWIIMELGDGQVAEHLGKNGLETFYEALSNI